MRIYLPRFASLCESACAMDNPDPIVVDRSLKFQAQKIHEDFSFIDFNKSSLNLALFLGQCTLFIPQLPIFLSNESVSAEMQCPRIYRCYAFGCTERSEDISPHYLSWSLHSLYGNHANKDFRHHNVVSAT
jgi:hypothetical protein